VAFSPHKSSDVSLALVAQAIKNAKSAVLFAIMELSGAGPVISEVKSLAATSTNIFSYGVTQSLSGMSLYKPGATGGILTPFAFLAMKLVGAGYLIFLGLRMLLSRAPERVEGALLLLRESLGLEPKMAGVLGSIVLMVGIWFVIRFLMRKAGLPT